MSSKSKTRKTYDDTFKFNSLKAWKASGKSAKAFRDDYGIPERKFYDWAEKFETDAGIITPEESAELKRLRKENAELRLKTAILKKAMGYFANPK